MHELSIASAIVEKIVEFAAGKDIAKVVEIRLAVGELSCIEPEQLRFCISSISRETVMEDSTVEIENVAAEVRCPHCEYAGPPKYWDDALSASRIPTLQCPECGKAAEALQGEDCSIRTIRYAA